MPIMTQLCFIMVSSHLLASRSCYGASHEYERFHARVVAGQLCCTPLTPCPHASLVGSWSVVRRGVDVSRLALLAVGCVERLGLVDSRRRSRPRASCGGAGLVCRLAVWDSGMDQKEAQHLDDIAALLAWLPPVMASGAGVLCLCSLRRGSVLRGGAWRSCLIMAALLLRLCQLWRVVFDNVSSPAPVAVSRRWLVFRARRGDDHALPGAYLATWGAGIGLAMAVAIAGLVVFPGLSAAGRRVDAGLVAGASFAGGLRLCGPGGRQRHAARLCRRHDRGANMGGGDAGGSGRDLADPASVPRYRWVLAAVLFMALLHWRTVHLANGALAHIAIHAAAVGAIGSALSANAAMAAHDCRGWAELILGQALPPRQWAVATGTSASVAVLAWCGSASGGRCAGRTSTVSTVGRGICRH